MRRHALQRRKPEGLLRAAALRSLAKALNESRLTDPLVSRSIRRNVPKDTEWPSPRGDGMATPLPRRAAAAVLLALLTITGCTDARSDTAPTTSPRTTPAPPSSSPPPDAAAKAEALAAYRGFWAAASAAEAHPNRRHPLLSKFATDKALAAEQATLVLYRQQGIVGRGKPKLSPQIVAINLGGPQPSADITDCLDLTGVDAVYRSSGKSAIAPNQSRRHKATATAVLSGGRWVIQELIADRKQTC
jgi:hypothetical protein